MGKENNDEIFSCVLVRISRQAIKITSVINIIFLQNSVLRLRNALSLSRN